MGEERVAKRSTFENRRRKRLSDITNYDPQQRKSSMPFDQSLQLNSSTSLAKEQIDHLLKVEFYLGFLS